MIFSNNQVRQLYVATKKVDATPTSLGELQVKQTQDGKVFCLHYGQGGLTRTDLIDPKTVDHAVLTPAVKMEHKQKAIEVRLDPAVNGGNPIVGQDYILRILFKQYLSPDEGDQYIKDAAVRALPNMSQTDFYKEMLKSLIRNFSRESAKMVAFYAEGASAAKEVKTIAEVDALAAVEAIHIEEVEQPWVLGTMPLEFVNFEVYTGEITYQGVDLNWGVVTAAEPEAEEPIGNGKIIADMEYFYHGERGDQYRNIGWPNVIPTKYIVDPTQTYDVIDIHHAYVGANHSVQKSEKDLTIVVPAGDTTIKEALATAGIEFTA